MTCSVLVARWHHPRAGHLRHTELRNRTSQGDLLRGHNRRADPLWGEKAGGQSGKDRQIRFERGRHQHVRPRTVRKEVSMDIVTQISLRYVVHPHQVPGPEYGKGVQLVSH